MSDQVIGKILAVGCALLWAGAVILFKRSGETMKPLPLNFFKSTVSALLFLPFFVMLDEPFFPVNATTEDYLRLIVSGIVGITISDSLFFMSLNLLGAGLSAIVDCMYSPILVGLSWILLAEQPSSTDLAGGAIIIAGVFMASFHKNPNHPNRSTLVIGIALGIAAMGTVGLGVMIMQPVLARSSILWLTEVRLVAGSLSLGCLLLASSARREYLISLRNSRLYKYTVPAAIMGTNLAMITWVGAFKLTGVTSAAILNQSSTVFTVALAAIFLHESLTPRRVLAVLCAMIGAVLVLVS